MALFCVVILFVVSCFQAVFRAPVVEFKSANLANCAACSKVFHDDCGAYDIVFNLATETKCGQSDEVNHSSSSYLLPHIGGTL